MVTRLAVGPPRVVREVMIARRQITRSAAGSYVKAQAGSNTFSAFGFDAARLRAAIRQTFLSVVRAAWRFAAPCGPPQCRTVGLRHHRPGVSAVDNVSARVARA